MGMDARGHFLQAYLVEPRQQVWGKRGRMNGYAEMTPCAWD